MPSSFDTLPTELLTHILRYILDSEDGISSFAEVLAPLTSVCRSWRSTLFGTPSLWRGARFTPRSITADLARATRALDIFDRYSESTLTHVACMLDICAKSFHQRLDVLRRSGATLLDLRLYGYCRCKACCVNYGPEKRAPCEFFEGAFASLLHLISQVPNLQRLDFNVEIFCPSSDQDGDELAGISPAARPKGLHISAPLYAGGDFPQAEAQAQAIFSQLAEEVEHFSYNLYEGDLAWGCWAWDIVMRRAQHLRSLTIDLDDNDAARLESLSGLDFPLLEQATLLSVPDDVSLPSTKRTWFRMPALEQVRTYPSMAARLSAPLVQHAYFFIRVTEDVKALEKVLASWEHLNSLTLAMPYLAFDGDGWAGEAIEDIIQLLTPAPHERGQVRAPNLRHLGIIDDRSDHEVRPNDWAAKPWPSDAPSFDEAEWRFDCESGGKVVLSRSVLDLVRQRQELHEGGGGGDGAIQADADSSLTSTSAERSCAPLETLKLARMHIDAALWEELQQCTTHVSCRPHPTTLGDTTSVA